MTQRNLVLLLVAVCVLSAAIGSGLALLAQTGPAGATGKQGPRGKPGPQGSEGPSGAAEVEGLEAEVEELRGQVEDSEELAGRLEAVEEELSSGFSGPNEELCEEFGVGC